MPVEREFDEDRNVLVTRLRGRLEPDALLAALMDLETDERMRPGSRSWVDLTDLDPGDIDAEVIRRAADMARRFDEGRSAIRIAVLAPGDLTFGLARMYSMMVDVLHREVRVFRDAAEARAWLCAAESEGAA
jgi:hypothetical protein